MAQSIHSGNDQETHSGAVAKSLHAGLRRSLLGKVQPVAKTLIAASMALPGQEQDLSEIMISSKHEQDKIMAPSRFEWCTADHCCEVWS